MLFHIKKLFSSKNRAIFYAVSVIAGYLIWWHYTDINTMFGNYGRIHTYSDITLSMIVIFGFPLFLVAFFYKSYYFGKKDVINIQSSGGIIGGILGTIISGASCCGATLAVSFGLLPLMNVLPWRGLEIKIISVLGLLYALYDILKNLESCKYKPKRN